jgi:hypothetical protein
MQCPHVLHGSTSNPDCLSIVIACCQSLICIGLPRIQDTASHCEIDFPVSLTPCTAVKRPGNISETRDVGRQQSRTRKNSINCGLTRIPRRKVLGSLIHRPVPPTPLTFDTRPIYPSLSVKMCFGNADPVIIKTRRRSARPKHATYVSRPETAHYRREVTQTTVRRSQSAHRPSRDHLRGSDGYGGRERSRSRVRIVERR